MSSARKLIEEIREFGRCNPGHQESVGRLAEAVTRIDRYFEGETREKLLGEARRAFRKQVEALASLARTRDSLLRLQENQRQLVEALERIAVEQRAATKTETPRRRPDGVTLH